MYIEYHCNTFSYLTNVRTYEVLLPHYVNNVGVADIFLYLCLL